MTVALTPAPTALVISRSRGDHPVLVVSVHGRLDGQTVPELHRRMADILRGRGSADVLVLDLTELRTISPSGLSATHQVCRDAGAAGLRVLLVSTGRLADLVREHSPSGPHEVFGTRREAVAATGHHRRPHRPGYGPELTLLAG